MRNDKNLKDYRIISYRLHFLLSLGIIALFSLSSCNKINHKNNPIKAGTYFKNCQEITYFLNIKEIDNEEYNAKNGVNVVKDAMYQNHSFSEYLAKGSISGAFTSIFQKEQEPKYYLLDFYSLKDNERFETYNFHNLKDHNQFEKNEPIGYFDDNKNEFIPSAEKLDYVIIVWNSEYLTLDLVK